MLKKYIITKNVIEVYEFQKYICGKGGARDITRGMSTDIEKSLQNYKNQTVRRRENVRRLATMNFDNNSKFLTLTFEKNITNLDYSNLEFKNFIKRLSYRLTQKIKYLAVIEFQKRGAIHYHVLLDIPYIPQKDLQKLWGNGFVFINAISHVDNIGAYICKYMSKEGADERLRNRRAYLKSNNLTRPEKIINHNLRDFYTLEKKLINKYNLNSKKPVYVSNFETEILGNCRYTQYNLKRE